MNEKKEDLQAHTLSPEELAAATGGASLTSFVKEHDGFVLGGVDRLRIRSIAAHAYDIASPALSGGLVSRLEGLRAFKLG